MMTREALPVCMSSSGQLIENGESESDSQLFQLFSEIHSVTNPSIEPSIAAENRADSVVKSAVIRKAGREKVG
jgi:hypothetical protein